MLRAKRDQNKKQEKNREKKEKKRKSALHFNHKLCLFSHSEKEAAMAPIILQSSLPINVSESDIELQGVIFWSKTISGQIKLMSFYFSC